MPSNKKIFIIFTVGVVLISFWLGNIFGKNQVVCEICPPQNVDFSLFWEAWNLVHQNFIKTDKLDTQNMIYGAISGMINSLEDPHTTFFNPADSKKFTEDVSGRFEGIGIEIGVRKKKLQVIAPLENTPAQKAGLRAGDEILKINDKTTAEITIEEAVDLIRGPRNTEVSLTIFRDEWETAKEFKIERAVIEVPSLRWELLPENAAYLKLYQFSERSDVDFRIAAREIINSPAQKIILDLRNNPGGYLQRAQDIAGWFLEKGQTVVTEDFGGKKEQIVYKADGNSLLLGYPLVILINQGSASASEILASALRDNRGIKLIGETSFGKGSVQEMEGLRNGSSLKITVANWLTPKGKLINEIGLEPDIKIEMADQDYEQNKDPQLDKALEIIKGIE